MMDGSQHREALLILVACLAPKNESTVFWPSYSLSRYRPKISILKAEMPNEQIGNRAVDCALQGSSGYMFLVSWGTRGCRFRLIRFLLAPFTHRPCITVKNTCYFKTLSTSLRSVQYGFPSCGKAGSHLVRSNIAEQVPSHQATDRLCCATNGSSDVGCWISPISLIPLTQGIRDEAVTVVIL